MNSRYRKATRLRSRHHRRGHTPWCNCPEQWARLFRAVERWKRTQHPLPTVTVRMTEEQQP